jgi:hypothetical protein
MRVTFHAEPCQQGNGALDLLAKPMFRARRDRGNKRGF